MVGAHISSQSSSNVGLQAARLRRQSLCNIHPSSKDPRRLYLHRSIKPAFPVSIAGPRPILRVCNQSSHHGVPMHVAALFKPLLIGEDIEIINRRCQKGRGNDRRATEIFSACSTTDSVTSFGSLTSRCTCSGITTYESTVKQYFFRIASSADSKTSRDRASARNGCRR